jgi:hypothetical protein
LKRSATEILRRGFQVTVANWPVIAFRLVESMLFVGLVVAAVIAIIVPFVASVGMGNLNDVGGLTNALMERWVIIVYALVVAMAVVVLFIAIHAFVDAGTAQILIDSERNNAAPSFNIDRWLSGGRAGWWPVFWMYNVIWSVAGAVLLVPLAATLAAMFAVTADAGKIVVACSGLALTFVLLLPLGVLAGMWTQKSIVVCVARNAPATESMRAARQEMRRDFGRHLVVAVIVIVVSIGGAGVISMLSMPLSFARESNPMSIGVMAPVQIVLSFVQGIFSAAVGTWFLASYVGLTEER